MAKKKKRERERERERARSREIQETHEFKSLKKFMVG